MWTTWDEIDASKVRKVIQDLGYRYDHDRGCWTRPFGLLAPPTVTRVIEELGGDPKGLRTREATLTLLRALEDELKANTTPLDKMFAPGTPAREQAMAIFKAKHPEHLPDQS